MYNRLIVICKCAVIFYSCMEVFLIIVVAYIAIIYRKGQVVYDKQLNLNAKVIRIDWLKEVIFVKCKGWGSYSRAIEEIRVLTEAEKMEYYLKEL